MFYRRKIILSLLQIFGGELEKINFYKLLFIFSKRQQKPEYDFIPYKFGCYSFSVQADLITMDKKSLLKDKDESITKLDRKNYLSTLNDSDKKLIIELHNQFVNSTADDLMRFSYVNYPYTAINSKTAERLLTYEQLMNVNAHRPESDKKILFTIGYEGISLEEYLNRMIKHDVKVLIDVRNNPISMKFGFSKNQLKNYCEKIKIEYLHIPEVGIESELRQELNTQSDYNKLFAYYRKNNLPKTISYQQKIFELLKSKHRIALTCFEADVCQCHRKHLAEAITQLSGWYYELKHL